MARRNTVRRGKPPTIDDAAAQLRDLAEVLLNCVLDPPATSPNPPVSAVAFPPVVDDFECLSCCTELASEPSFLYCSRICGDKAVLVRYVRRACADRRIRRADVREAIGVRLLMLTAGGYPAKARRVPNTMRAFVFERDRQICQVCGEPATEIDHIHGHESTAENLQAICGPCNRARAIARARTVSYEVDPGEWTRLNDLYNELAQRMSTANPRRCDDERTWGGDWKRISADRRVHYRELGHPSDAGWEDIDNRVWEAMQKDD